MDLHRDPPNRFAGPYLDRRAELREAPDWLAEALADPTTLFLVSWGTTHLLHAGPEPRIAFLTADHPIVREAREHQLTLLGWVEDRRCVLVALEDDGPVRANSDLRLEELRPIAAQLSPEHAGLLAYARALSIWRTNHRFCGACGEPMVPIRAGQVLRCSSEPCARESFPRIDPAIIVLVTDGARALLGRQASWPPGRYSTIAGFVEPGESLEDAVVREVREETNARVRHVEYHSSQPWPFPSSLMIGFQAVAQPDCHIEVSGELEDARWFTREEIAACMPLLPTSYSIAYRLIETWFDRGWPTPLATLHAIAKGEAR